MKVEQLMTRNVHTCRGADTLNRAAQVMWEHDCGVVPVVGPGNGTARVIGMITDRDICMAAYTQGRPLEEITVASAMSRDVLSCRPTDALAVALRVMETNKLNRVPVVDQDDRIIGILSLADIVREARYERGAETVQVSDLAVAGALQAIKTSRSTGALVPAA